MYVRSDIVDVFHRLTTTWCNIVKIGNMHVANVYKLPSEHWNESNLLPVLRHRAIYIGDFNIHHTDWVYTHCNQDGGKLNSWASNKDLEILNTRRKAERHISVSTMAERFFTRSVLGILIMRSSTAKQFHCPWRLSTQPT